MESAQQYASLPIYVKPMSERLVTYTGVSILTWIELHHVLRLFPHFQTLEARRAATQITRRIYAHTHTRVCRGSNDV